MGKKTCRNADDRDMFQPKEADDAEADNHA